MTRRKRRWGDHDRRFGPFTLSVPDFKRLGAMFDTGEDDYDESSEASLRLHAFRCTLIVEMPTVLPRGREYGAFLSEDYVHVHHGPQTFDSRTTRSTLWPVPWLQWRHVRHSLYGLRGEHVWTESKGDPFEVWYAARNACPAVSFDFDDFDGERITARTHIEEREWRLGTKWCAWLSLFRRPRVHRSLDLEFSKETGKRKGSWKGGTIGHSIEMQPGELHEAAFRRYCAEHSMAFVGRTPESAP